jgi:membrane peptidoglycan carboxypeptidase
MAIHAAVIVVVTMPFDEDQLVATGEPLVVLDLRGEEIATLPAIGVDRTRWIPLAKIPAIAVAAVVESEDHNFYRHRGVDGVGIARAMYLNLRGGRYGGATLTMQLSRMGLGTNNRTVKSLSARPRSGNRPITLEIARQPCMMTGWGTVAQAAASIPATREGLRATHSIAR